MSSNPVSARIVTQRIRNRIMEYLDLVATAEAGPRHLKTSDIVNIWEDYVDMSNPVFPSPPYSGGESESLMHFARVWDWFANQTEPWPDSYNELFSHPAWPPFRDAAAATLCVLHQRGPSDED
jgi:hypothetical protein